MAITYLDKVFKPDPIQLQEISDGMLAQAMALEIGQSFETAGIYSSEMSKVIFDIIDAAKLMGVSLKITTSRSKISNNSVRLIREQ